MAFTSEAILKFGTNTITFAVGTLLNYSIQNEKIGAFNYRRKETISLDGIFSQVGLTKPIKQHFSDIQSLISKASDFVDLKINDVSYGKAKFLSFNFPTSVNFDENAARFSKFTIQLEIIKNDPDNKFVNDNLPTDVKTLTKEPSIPWSKLKEFTESFSFRLGEDGNFEASHSLGFGYDNVDKLSDAGVVAEAVKVANSFFKQALSSLSSIDSLYSATDFQTSVSDYGSSLTEQSVDLINYKFSYSKNYTVFATNGSNTSETITAEVSFKDDGIIEVTEKGQIKGKGTSYALARSNAKAKLETNLTTAYTNCSAALTRYLSNNYTDIVLPKYRISTSVLNVTPISITKNLSDITPEIGYEIKFTTHPAHAESTKIHTYTIDLKKDISGVYDAVINGSIKYLTNKRKNFLNNLSVVRESIESVGLDAISPYYLIIANLSKEYSYNGTKTNSAINIAKYGVEISYSKTYSDSPTFNTYSDLISKLTASENYEDPINKYSTVQLLGTPKELGKEIIYQTTQLSGGARSVNLEMLINREKLSSLTKIKNSSPDLIFQHILMLLTKYTLDKSTGYLFQIINGKSIMLNLFEKIYKTGTFKAGELTYFLDDLKLSIDHNYNLKVNLVFKFFVSRESKSIGFTNVTGEG